MLYSATSILESLGTAVVVVDHHGEITFANSRAAAVLGTSPEALTGTQVSKLIAPIREIAASANREGDERSVSTVLGADGEQVSLGYKASAVENALGIAGAPQWSVVFQDIGGFERLRAERDRLMQLVGVSEVLPAVLHELKNPLAAIDNAVELLIEELPESAARHDLHAILGEIRRMKLTLEGLGSMDRELHASRHAAIDLALSETCRVIERQATPKGITLHCELPALPLLPFAPAVIRAIAFNLMTNAMHACASGGTIGLLARLVKSESCPADAPDGKTRPDTFELVVSDDGVGMTQDVLTRCTEPFFTTKPKGTGIGLALVDRLTRAAGGSLHIDSTPRCGTRITLHIPLERPRHSSHPPPRIHASRDGTSRSAGT